MSCKLLFNKLKTNNIKSFLNNSNIKLKCFSSTKIQLNQQSSNLEGSKRIDLEVEKVNISKKQTPNSSYNIIEPKFTILDEIINPTKDYELDCSKYNMKNLANNERQEIVLKMKQIYEERGLILLTNTGLTDLNDMRSWALVLVEQGSAYTGGANPRKQIDTNNIYDVGAPKEAWLHYHHEMAYVSKSPKALSLFCKNRVPNKGWTYVSDSVAATDAILKTDFGQKLKAKNICYVRNLTDKQFYKNEDESEIYNHWQDSFMTDKMDEVEPLAKERGLKIEWDIQGQNRFLKTKYYVSAFEYFEPLDRNILYSSVADDFMWFDSWPGIKSVNVDERPLKLTFGDDTELTQSERQQYVDIYDRFGVPIRWQVGDVAVLCNYRWVHGRPGYNLNKGEQRDLGVVIGSTFDRIGHRINKW